MHRISANRAGVVPMQMPASTVRPLEVALFDSEERLVTLDVDWNRLASGSGSCMSITWEWLHTWWSVYGRERCELRVVTVRRDGVLIGALPLVCYVERMGMRRARVLRFLGTGEPEADEVVSEYIDMLAVPGCDAVVAAAISEYLVEHRHAWDVLVLKDLLADARVLQTLAPLLAARGCEIRRERAGARYWVALPDSFDAYVATLRDGDAKRLLYKRRKLQRAGEVDFRLADGEGGRAEAFEYLRQMHAARWSQRGRPGVFASKLFTQFHRTLLARLTGRGAARLYLLRLNQRPIAALYNLRCGSTEFFYQSGFDVAEGRYSPGVVAHVMAIERAINDKVGVYDFMKDVDGSYKSAFGCRETPMHSVTVYSPTPAGRWLAGWARLKCGVRKIRQNIRARHTPASDTEQVG